MSAFNGDKARFQLRRRAGLKRREHSRLAAASLRLHAADVVASVAGAKSGRNDQEPALSVARGAEAR